MKKLQEQLAGLENFSSLLEVFTINLNMVLLLQYCEQLNSCWLLMDMKL